MYFLGDVLCPLDDNDATLETAILLPFSVLAAQTGQPKNSADVLSMRKWYTYRESSKEDDGGHHSMYAPEVESIHQTCPAADPQDSSD